MILSNGSDGLLGRVGSPTGPPDVDYEVWLRVLVGLDLIDALLNGLSRNGVGSKGLATQNPTG